MVQGSSLIEVRRIELAPGVDARRVLVAERAYDVLTTARTDDVRVTPAGRMGATVAERAKQLQAAGEQVFLVMNAGMFHPGYRAVGLVVSAGTVESPVELGAGSGNFFLKPNGVFGVTKEAFLLGPSAEVAAQQRRRHAAGGSLLREATQSGPLLLHNGRWHSAADPASSHRFVRNAVGITPQGAAVFAISREPVSFFELSRALVELGCRDGLYLDGAVSTAYLPALDRGLSSRRLGPLVSVSRPRDAAGD